MSQQEPIVLNERKSVDLLRTIMGIGGLVALVVGVLILFNPVGSGTAIMTVVTAILAAYMVVAGLVFIGSMIFSKTMSGWRRVGNAVLGLLYLIVGIIVFGNLENTAVVLVAFLSIFIGVTWIIEAILTFAAVKRSPSKVWSIIYGIVGIIAGLALIIFPFLGAVTLWLLLGASLVVLGVVQIVRALTLKPRK